MKKLFSFLLVVTLLILLVSCDIISVFKDCKHTVGDYHTNNSQHWRNYTCGCDIDAVYEDHYDENSDGKCDACGYGMYNGLDHVCSTEYYMDAENHCLRSVCGCHGFPEFLEPHYDLNNDESCDACGYFMGDDEDNVALSDFESWLNYASSDGIVEVKTILNPGVDYGDLITIHRTTDKNSIAQMIELYKNVELEAIPEDVDIDLVPGHFEIEFTFAGGDVKTISFAGRSLYTDYKNRRSYFALNLPSLESCAHYKTSYSFATYGKNGAIAYLYDYDDGGNLIEYCKLDKIGKLEFEAYPDVYYPENEPTHLIRTEFGDIYVMSHKSFFIIDESGNSTWFVLKNEDFYRIFERALQTDFTVTMNNPEWLAEELQPTYKAGDTVSVKIYMATDTGYMFFVNGNEVTQSDWDDDLWIFTFTMPNEDVVIDFKTYDGFLPHWNYGALIENYWMDHFDANRIWVDQYYGEFDSGAIVAYMGCDCCMYTEALWTEYIDEYEINYCDGRRIEVLYKGEFYTLTEAYNNGWLTDANIAKIAEMHNK